MSDNRRRLICRLVFLLVCALPTSLTVYQLSHPQTASQWQQQIQAQLGVTTTVDAIQTPSPSMTVLRGLRFRDPELGTLFEAAEARIILGKINRVEIPHAMQLTNTGLVQLIQTINQHLVRNHHVEQPWSIRFLAQTTIEEAIFSQQTQTLLPEMLVVENLQIDIGPFVDGTGAQLQFQLPSQTSDHKVVARISRSLATEDQPSQQRLELDTQEVPLPCWLLADLVPELQQLGTACQFAGHIEINPRSHTKVPYGRFTGRFTNLQIPAEMGWPVVTDRGNYAADVELCQLNGGIKKLNAHLIHPDGGRSPIQPTIEVIQQFDILGALRTAAHPHHFHADSQYR